MKKTVILSLLLFGFQLLFSQTDVGKTAGQLDVSLTGAATYSVPISVPPGIKDVVPKIGLAYNSQSGNAIAGWGWSISGLSSISRIPADMFHDGFIDPVDFDSNDRYALNGQRLILLSGTYGGNGSVYTTENFSNIKVKAFGTHPNGSQYGPMYFVAYYPTGDLEVYGNHYGSTGKLQWAISKWKDHQNNVIKYHYTTSYNNIMIDYIEYGGTEILTAINTINFQYKTRDRKEQSYVNGTSFRTTKILDNIKVKKEGTLLRKYKLTHDSTSLDYERLTEIQEFNGVGHNFEPIVFNYEDTTNEDLFLHSSTSVATDYDISAENSHSLSFDINEDGKMDIVTYKSSSYSSKFIFYESNETGFSSGDETYLLGCEHINSLHSGTAIIDGKIKPVLIVIYEKYEPSYNERIRYKVFKFSGGDLVVHSSSKLFVPIHQRVVVSDFNGDGVSDIITINYGTSNKNIHYFKGTLDGAFQAKLNIGVLDDSLFIESGVFAPITIGDFNGDGLGDIYIIWNDKIRIYSLNHNEDSLVLLTMYEEGGLMAEKPHLMGDYNGDGKTDFIQPISEDDDEWNIYYSKGNIFYKENISIGVNYLENDIKWVNIGGGTYFHLFCEYYYIPTDINQDGKMDIQIIENRTQLDGGEIGGDPYQTRVYLLENINVRPGVADFSIESSDFEDLNIDIYPLPIFLDHNSINNNLEIALIRNNKIHHFKHTKDNREDVLLRSVENNGITNEILYKNLEDNIIYTPDNSQNYPYININNAPSLKLVEKFYNPDNNNVRYFKYAGAHSHIGGLGFQGFKRTRRTAWTNTSLIENIWSITEQYDDPLMRGAVKNQYTTTSSEDYTSHYFSKTNYLYSTNLSVDKIFTILPTTITQEDALQGITTTVENGYDSYKNLIQVTTTYDDAIGSKVVDYTYANNDVLGSWYYIGLLTQKKETSNMYGASFESTAFYHYGGFVVNYVKKKGNGTNWITEYFQHDSFGNVTQKKLVASGIAPRIENFEYDSSGRFITKSTDIEGLETTYTYDNNTGALLTETNPFGQTTSYQYDGWGRKTGITDYLGNQTTITIENSAVYTNGVTKTIATADGGVSKSLYNAYGWLMLKSAKTLEGNWAAVETIYDALGRKEAVSEPYFTGTTPMGWTTYNYDNYGRPIEQTTPAGLTITTTYDGLSVTVNDGEKILTKTKDAAGNIVQSIDNGGTIDYTFHPNGTMKTANYAGRVVSTTIDGWGRKIALDDPDAGIYTYTYNDIGELLEETTPKGTTTHTYDDFGKTTNKTVSGDETDIEVRYRYNSTTKLPSSIIGDDNTTGKHFVQYFSYDSQKRLITVAEVINDYGLYAKQLTYDALGRVDQTTLRTRHNSSGTRSVQKIKNVYDPSGMLYQITDATTNEALWTINHENAKGQALEIDLGNGITKTRSYSANGYLTQMVDGTALNMQYDFDEQRGRLQDRQNNNFSWNENFAYDSQQRLTNITGSVNFTQTYDIKGRIKENSTIGQYGYGDSNYQVKTIELNDNGVDYYSDEGHNLQEITYNAFKKPVEIHEENHGRVSFEYSPISLSRSVSYYGSEDEEVADRPFAKHYSSIIPVEVVEDFENGTTKIITFIGGDAYSAPVVHIKQTGSETIDAYHYLHRDYLGSILAISDEAGNVVEQRQFGAWGVVDKFLDSSGNTEFSNETSLLNRGYTGHEHFFGVALIHMNGRMYDAQLGRFLSPDNFVQDPYNTQNFNRYGYVLNNPLMYADPSGEFIWAAVIIGALINMTVAAIQGKSFGQIMLAGVIGAVTGIIAGGIGNLAAGGAFFSEKALSVVGFWAGAGVGAASGAAGGFVGGGLNAWANGGDFGDVIGAAVKGAISGAFIGAAVGGVGAGIKARKMGVDFWKADKITDAEIFNNITSAAEAEAHAGDVASIDTEGIGMFENGERLSDFKADLSGDDWFAQSLKAHKKAFFYARHNKPLTMNELIDFDKGYKGWSSGHNKNIMRVFNGDINVSFSTIRNDRVYGVIYERNFAHFGKSVFMLSTGNGYNHAGAIVFARPNDALAENLFFNYIKRLF